MKSLLFLTLALMTFDLSANNEELTPLEDYARANNYTFSGFEQVKNPEEVMFNFSLRCAGFWSSLNEFPKLIMKGKSTLSDDIYKQATQKYTNDFVQSLTLFDNYKESMLSRMKDVYKKIFNNNLKERGGHLAGEIGENDLWTCTKFYSDISGIDINSFAKSFDSDKQTSEQGIKPKQNEPSDTSIDHIELWTRLIETQLSVWVSSPGSPNDTFHIDQLISKYCITIHNNPVCPFVDSTKYKFDKKMWDQFNRNLLQASRLGDGTILNVPHLEFVKYNYCVHKHKTTRCFADQKQ